jgi:Type ISP C-terminal specificity domain/N-6 DNA Methylase
MAGAQITLLVQGYATTIRNLLRANPATPETGLAPTFQQLVTALLPLLPAVPQLIVSPEFNQPGVGRPDIALKRQGQPARAFIELKAPAKFADPERWKDAHDKRQYGRLKELERWATSNFTGFHLFNRGDAAGEAIIAPIKALNPDTPDKTADKLIADHDAQPFLDLLAILARADAPAARNAKHLAGLMAHSARLVRSAVEERISELHVEGKDQHPLMLVRNTFKNVLYAHPEAGGYAAADFDTLFSSAFAQTLAFGLLLVRESIVGDVGKDAWEHMPDEHPLMKAALRVLSEQEVTREIGIGFDVMCDTVNSFAPEILALQKDGRDPILYFYEDFLEIFDPAARERYGVYYTPIEVVRYMTGALDRALRDNLGTQGLRDPAVTILDPATGTGTFLLGVAERVRDQVTADEGGPAASMALGDLAGRMFGFELLVGPYAVAHYRLHHALRNRPADEGEDAPQPVKLPRLGIYLADTLSNPETDAPMGGLGIQGIPIDEERREANRIKATQPILAIIGNPPYKRLVGNERETLVGRWIAGGVDEGGNSVEGKWDDLKKPVSEAGHGNQLNTFEEFSVAFWRWALWKLFESDNAPKKGVVALITNRKFLTGWPYAGLRKMMREKFDRIEIIDLRGDVRAGPRGDVDGDQGVFNIMVGTAITIAIADGSKAPGTLADVTYLDCWEEELFARRAKLDWLLSGSENGELPNVILVDRAALDDFRPTPFQNGEWLSIKEAFSFFKSGMKSGDNNAFVRVSREDLPVAVAGHLAGRADPAYAPAKERHYIFRLLDKRWLYNDLALLQRPGPAFQKAWGDTNFGIQALKSSTGLGPAGWCNSHLPDYDSFNARGGYAFPLYDRRIGPDATNISPILIAALAEAYGQPVAPEDIFDAILCLLSARSYTRRFAEDLEDVFPHIPFPAPHEVFQRAAAIGREIRGLQAFAREPAAAFRAKAFCRITAQPGDNAVIQAATYKDGALSLWKDGEKAVTAFTGIPDFVWSFSVSGYRVLPRWIDGRKGLPVTLALMRELRDVAARIAELIHWFDAADIALDATLGDTLTRAELGFPAPGPEEAEEGDD